MSGTPYIRLFGDDWLSGTNELSLAERGALITIVAITASTGDAPKYDLDRLSRRFGCTKGAAKKVLNSLSELGKISIENGAVLNGRALKETKISQKNSQKQSEKAKSRWTKSDEKTNENNAPANAVAIPRECQPEPEPEPYKRDTKVSPKKTRRGSRLPDDWVLPEGYGEYAISQGWGEAAIRLEADKFKDYWISVSGQKATKTDWLATWRNWLRNSTTPKLTPIQGGQGHDAINNTSTDRLLRVVTRAARGTSDQDWG